jgi:hypothetical protein
LTQSAVEVTDRLLALIQQSVETKQITVGPEEFLTRKVEMPPAPPTVTTLVIHTLQGVIDYLSNDKKFDRVIPPADANAGLAIHIVDETEVNVVGGVFGRFRQREVFVRARFNNIIGDSTFNFNEYVENEDFNIALRSRFIMTDGVEAILRITGNITEEDQGNWRDDGFSQTVTVKTGITKVEDIEITNLFTLQPYRTFREIQQPTSDFLLRLQKGTPPECALFETDGGGWKLTAIERIRTFLSEKLPDIPIIA